MESLDLLSVNRLAALFVHRLFHLAVFVLDERNLCRNNLPEEFGLGFREDLELLLARHLCQQLISFTPDRQHGEERVTVLTDISVEYVVGHLDDLFIFKFWSFEGATVLGVSCRRNIPLVITEEFHLGINNFPKELGLRGGKDLELGLAGQCGE